MEDISSNSVLCINNEELLKKKKNKILETLEENIDVFFFYDTETTGLNPYPKESGRDRILELAFIAYYMDDKGKFHQLEVDGHPVTFQEYTNPFKESKQELAKTRSVSKTDPYALEVHGITDNFLAGKEALAGVKLDKPAPTFKEVKPFMEDILCFEEQGDYDANIHFVSFNGKSFDDKMLEEEIKYVDAYDPSISYKRSFESLMASAIDAKLLMQKLYSRAELQEIGELDGKKAGHSLDYLSRMMEVNLDARADFHGGLLDSVILKDAFEALLKTDRYQEIHNKYQFNVKATEEKQEVVNKLDSYFAQETKEDGSVLNVIKTDASFHAGTGTIPEYISKAVDAGLDNLVLADDVSLSRFIEFYEGCNKAGIKPIIATNFKIESNFDIYNVFSAGKEQSAEARKLVLDVVNSAMGTEGRSFEKMISEDGLTDVVAWGKLIDKIKAVQNAQQKKQKLPAALLKAVNEVIEPAGKKTKLKVADLTAIIAKHDSIQEFQSFDRVSGHANLTLVAENDEGYETLKKLITVANRDGQGFVPEGKELNKGEVPLLKIDHLEDYNEGIFALLGGKDDILDKAIKSGYKTMPAGVIKNLQKVLDNRLSVQLSTFADLDSAKSIQEDKVRVQKLMGLSSEYNIPCLAAQNAVFANKEDYLAHINKAAILLDKDTTDFSFDVPESKYDYLHSKGELRKIFEDNKQAMANTATVIEGIENNVVLDTPTLPKFKTEGGATQAEELTRKAYEGLDKRVLAAFEKNGDNEKTYADFYKDYKERLDYELGIIIDMDFPGYFLIKQQMIQYCKQEGITVGAGRGSAAGSLVVYSLGITDVDPIEHDLIFERFLNPERKEMPDIDTDIDGNYREQVLDFLRDEYANDGGDFEGAAFIMTKGTFSAKSTIRKLGKAKGYSQSWCDDLAKLISKEPDVTLSDELEYNEVLQSRYEKEGRTKKFIDEVLELEKNGGRQAAIGKHAGGIVVGNLVSQAPISYSNGIPVVQYDKSDIERAGAVKFDLLGLGTLTKLDMALKNIIEMKGKEELEKNNINIEGKNFNFDTFNYDDKATYELLKSGNSTNVFQIESDMFKGLLDLIQPENLEEITSLVSLGRPGPLQAHMHIAFAESKFDKSKRRNYHELIDDLLDATHGTIVYQEQVMAIGQKMGGFTMGGADKLRKAMGKKKPEEMEKQKSLFIEGAEKNGVDSELSEEIFDTVEKFAGYGFNKSHAMSYSFLTYKTAFLRTHYPTEFMAAVLSVDANEGEFKKKIAKGIDSMKEVGLTLSTPNINTSESRFKPGKTTGILYGFDAVTGLSKKDQETIIEERKVAPFNSLEDFMKRAVHGSSVKHLVSCGAMDSLPLLAKPSQKVVDYIASLDKVEKRIFKREMVSKELEILSPFMSEKKKKEKYVMGSFKDADVIKGYDQVCDDFMENKNLMLSEGLAKEEATLSSYITAHPLDVGGVKEKIESEMSSDLIKLSEMDDNTKLDAEFAVAGIIKDCAFSRISKNGNKYAFVEISDGTSIEKVFLKNDDYIKINSELKSDKGFGIEPGQIISLDLRCYKDKTTGEVRKTTDGIYLPEFDKRHKNEQQRNQKRKRYGNH